MGLKIIHNLFDSRKLHGKTDSKRVIGKISCDGSVPQFVPVSNDLTSLTRCWANGSGRKAQPCVRPSNLSPVAPRGFISNNDDSPNTLGIENRFKREMGHAFASNIANT